MKKWLIFIAIAVAPTLTAVGMTAGPAEAAPVAVPPPSVVSIPATPAGHATGARTRGVDALSDYDNAQAALANQELATVGIGAGIGCAAGLAGLALAVIGALITVPVGCIVGATIGGFVALGEAAAGGPGLLQKCQRAMPAWACQTGWW